MRSVRTPMRKAYGIIPIALLTIGCSSGTSQTGLDKDGGGKPKEINVTSNATPNTTKYPLVWRYNAQRSNGTILRWQSRTVSVDPNMANVGRTSFGEWTGFRFPVSNRPNITFGGYDNSLNVCGRATYSWRGSKLMSCRITLNRDYHDRGFCGTVKNTVTHELGHCLGILNHTSNGGIMDSKTNGSNVITGDVRHMLNQLYSLPVGSRMAADGRLVLSRGNNESGSATIHQHTEECNHGITP